MTYKSGVATITFFRFRTILPNARDIAKILLTRGTSNCRCVTLPFFTDSMRALSTGYIHAWIEWKFYFCFWSDWRLEFVYTFQHAKCLFFVCTHSHRRAYGLWWCVLLYLRYCREWHASPQRWPQSNSGRWQVQSQRCFHNNYSPAPIAFPRRNRWSRRVTFAWMPPPNGCRFFQTFSHSTLPKTVWFYHQISLWSAFSPFSFGPFLGFCFECVASNQNEPSMIHIFRRAHRIQRKPKHACHQFSHRQNICKKPKTNCHLPNFDATSESLKWLTDPPFVSDDFSLHMHPLGVCICTICRFQNTRRDNRQTDRNSKIWTHIWWPADFHTTNSKFWSFK